MLKNLQKALGLAPEAPKTELSVETLQASLATLTADFEAFRAEADATAAQAEAALAALSAELSTAQANALALANKLAAVEAEKLAAVADAEAKRLTARKEKVEAAVGTEKSVALLAATEALDDAAFEAVVSALGTSLDAEAQSKLFNEQGADVQADKSVVVESAEARILKDKYGQKK